MRSPLLALALLAGCHGGATTTTTDGANGATDMATGGCIWTAATTPTGTGNGGCAMLERDTSACHDARAAAGLSGFWLDFSCDVTLTVSGGNVVIATKSVPDYESNYFAATDACHTATPSGHQQNPNLITSQASSFTIPLSPSGAAQAMGLGPVGVALNGVDIFDNQAAPGDDIFNEVVTFDACEGHPTMNGVYHYHIEPSAISYDDASFIGVLRDGYAVYGRRDMEGSLPTLDGDGGHLGVPPGGTSAVYHYHLNKQTEASTGATAWFLTTGTYHGAPGSCSACM